MTHAHDVLLTHATDAQGWSCPKCGAPTFTEEGRLCAACRDRTPGARTFTGTTLLNNEHPRQIPAGGYYLAPTEGREARWIERTDG